MKAYSRWLNLNHQMTQFRRRLLVAASITAALLVLGVPLVVRTQGLPDLVVRSVSGPVAANTEETIVVETTVENQGAGKAWEHFLVGMYLSEDEVITTDDVRLGASWVYGLAPGAQANRNIVGTIPRNLPGTYYIGVIVDFFF